MIQPVDQPDCAPPPYPDMPVDPEPTSPPSTPPDLTPSDLASAIALLGFDPATVATVVLSPTGVHAIAATLVEPPTTPTEEATDADA